MYEYEYETMPELAWEDAGQGEWEDEYEDEAELFFSRLAGLARRAAQSPALRRIGLSAARSALGGLGAAGGALGSALGGQQGADLGRQLGAGLGSRLSGMLPQREFEFEDEFEYEGAPEGHLEDEVNPIQRIYPGPLMEHLGHAAAQAENEAEAEAFIGALVPLAAQLIPRAAPALMGAAPGLVRGLAGAARSLRSSSTTRPLVRTLPTVMQRTAASLARQAATGKSVTPQSAVRTLAQQTARVISSPQQATQAYQRSRAMDQRFHQQQAAPELMY
jgi:hypothetical protein